MDFLNEYRQKINNIYSYLKEQGRTKEVFPVILEFRKETEEYLSSCKDEMMYAVVYNTLATIMTAPEGCSYFQLEEAIKDALNEIDMMKEYM
ncbi:MAG: hypothetical protein E7396_03795 [Ruminococcaceae bacterium]|nr:hypothetical protein [Oscillospiraceae bacterium]